MPLPLLLAGIGLGISGVGMGASFLQAGKQKRLGEKAERDAAKIMDAARKKLDVNYLDALAINKLPYELEREALLVQGAMGVDAARESERGAAAGVGRIQLAQQQGQQGIRSAMSQEMIGLDRAAVQEDSRLRDVGVQLDLGEVAGAQMASADASQAAAAATTQGFQQLASFGAQALEAAPLFSKTPAARAQAQSQRQAVRTDKANYMKGSGKGKGAFGIGTGYNKFAPKTPETIFDISGTSTITGVNMAGGKDYALANLQKKQLSSIDAGMINRINKAGFSTDGAQIGQNFDLSSIQSMSPQELEAYMRGMSPGQMNIINQGIGLY
tara:strand:- start:10404 stop:11384 length:981 start_codon:yes stop_codon:yes gene_type:complete